MKVRRKAAAEENYTNWKLYSYTLEELGLEPLTADGSRYVQNGQRRGSTMNKIYARIECGQLSEERRDV